MTTILSDGWKLSRVRDGLRYVQRRVGGQKRERFLHSLVMESILGRPLAPGEFVRHRNGDGLDNRPENLELVGPTTFAQRFWDRVDKSSECWTWTGYRNRLGYGMVNGRAFGSNRPLLAHRVAYQLSVGTVPVGLDLDHLCRNPSCVRPDHLEPVTHAENLRRGAPATKLFCTRGHARNEENTGVQSDGRRFCRPCCRVREAARRPRRHGTRYPPRVN